MKISIVFGSGFFKESRIGLFTFREEEEVLLCFVEDFGGDGQISLMFISVDTEDDCKRSGSKGLFFA
jgi:hypothetical protein